MFSIDERVAYYARGILKPTEIVLDDSNYTRYYDLEHNDVKKRCIGHDSIWSARKNRAIVKLYYDDLDTHMRKDVGVMFIIGDVQHNHHHPGLAKSRPVNSQNNVLLPLNIVRHWGQVSKAYNDDLSFNDKDNKIVWRGCTTGLWTSAEGRKAVVERWAQTENPLIDIGLSMWVQGIRDKDEWIKPKLSIKDQLKSKFLISVEGNDVASGLKWMLASNSCVLMTKPRLCSWAMEDKLEEWKHYVPLKADYSDLETQYQWCMKNLDKCEQIALNGKRFIGDNFLDPEQEKEITNRIMQLWRDNVKIIASKEHITSPDAVNVVRKD